MLILFKKFGKTNKPKPTPQGLPKFQQKVRKKVFLLMFLIFAKQIPPCNNEQACTKPYAFEISIS